MEFFLNWHFEMNPLRLQLTGGGGLNGKAHPSWWVRAGIIISHLSSRRPLYGCALSRGDPPRPVQPRTMRLMCFRSLFQRCGRRMEIACQGKQNGQFLLPFPPPALAGSLLTHSWRLCCDIPLVGAKIIFSFLFFFLFYLEHSQC